MGQGTNLRGRCLTISNSIAGAEPKAMTLRIWFHGTDKETAEKIARDGFTAATTFSPHLEDALAFGGNYVFEVGLDLAEPKSVPSEIWQVVISRALPVSHIIALHRYDITRMHENSALRSEVAAANQSARDNER